MDEGYYELALHYREGLQKIYETISRNVKCTCDFVPNWLTILDNGAEPLSSELRVDGKACVFCQVEHYYAEAIGQDLFNEQVLVRLQQFLDERYTDPVAVCFIDDEGKEELVIIERAIAESMEDEDDDDEW